MKMFRTRLLTYAFLGSAYLLCQNVTTYAMPVHTAQTVIFQPQSSDNRMGIAASPAAGEPSAISSDTTTPEQSNTQPLAAVRIRKCTATSHSAIYITWTKNAHASKYEIYRATSAKGNYKCIASTRKPQYTDKTGKVFTTYYYKVKAVSDDPRTYSDSSYSKIVSATVRKKAKKIAYVGDSIMAGFREYNIVKGKSNKDFSKIGIHTYNYYTSDYMKRLLQYKPDRMIIMLGMNSLGGNPGKTQIDNILNPYKKILNACHKKNPHMEIVIMGVSPTRNSSEVNNAAVRRFNKALKKYANSKKYLHYFDTVSFLADKSGSLKASYSGGDGIHWSKSGYNITYRKLQKYIKEW